MRGRVLNSIPVTAPCWAPVLKVPSPLEQSVSVCPFTGALAPYPYYTHKDHVVNRRITALPATYFQADMSNVKTC